MTTLVMTLCVSYATLASFTLYLGEKLDDWWEEESKRRLGLRLREGVHRNSKAWLETIHQAFLGSFARVFSAKGSAVERSIWIGLLLSPITLLGIRIPALFGMESFSDDAADSLLFAILLAFSVSLRVAIGSGRVFLAFGFAFGSLGLFLNVPELSLLGGILLFALVAGSEHHTSTGTGIFSTGFALGFCLSIAVNLDSLLFTLIPSSVPEIGLLVLRWFSIFAVCVGVYRLAAVGEVLVRYVLSSHASPSVQDIHISVHPLKALASSLVFIIVVSIVVSLIRTDAASSLFDSINQQGIKILAFVAFNIFGDAISLLETRWVLQRCSSVAVVQLLGLLALDLVASATIFLFLPIVVGEIAAFWDSAFLRGDRPWLGILFWSTFGTSVLFYLFVIASLLVHPLMALLRGFEFVSQPFKLEEHPFRCIAISMLLILAVVFVIGYLTAFIAS